MMMRRVNVRKLGVSRLRIHCGDCGLRIIFSHPNGGSFV